MSLTPIQLAELQVIADVISENFPDNANNEWWAAMRILNADLGPSGPGGQGAFDATIANMKLTQGQIQPYQGRLSSPSTAFREATLQVLPSGGGGAGDYFSANLVGTATRTHTITGAVSVSESYTNGLVVSVLSKSAVEFDYSGLDAGTGRVGSLLIDVTNASIVLGILDGIVASSISMDSTGITLDAAQQRVSIITGLSTGLQAFDDDAAADTGGLTEGDLYQTTGAAAAPLDAAGIVMIKQPGI